MNPQLLSHSPSYLFVPPALAALNIKPENCQLVASYNKSSNQTRFTYSVSWSSDNQSYKDDGKRFKDDDRLELSIRAPIDEDSQVIDNLQNWVCKAKPNEQVRCDGPCGHKYPPEALEALGRCGHFLCDICHGLVYNEDGTKGCSNFDCVYATLYSYLPEAYARRAYESHILARQRAREKRDKPAASQQSACTNQPSSKSSCDQKGQSGCRTSSRPRTPRQLGRKSSLTFVNRRGSKKRSPVQSRTPLEDDPQTSNLPNSSGPRSPPDQWSRKMRVLDAIFSDMSVASSTQEGPTSEFELLNIRLMIFEPGPFKTIKRVHISREMSAALTVKEALDELVDRRNGNIRHECPSRLYFCSENTSEGLRRISVEETFQRSKAGAIQTFQFESSRLWQYPARNSVLHFVLDAVGYLKGKGED